MGVHIDDELLARLIGPGLAEHERRPVLAHLESCDECRRSAADAMQLADETRTLAGRYRLEGELGRGGMGMVFRARDDVLERIVAIKLLPPGTTADPRARARLVRESKAMARLRHPNVVAVYDAGYDGDQFFVAMEHVPGATLRTWLSTRTRTQTEIVAMLVKAARGLAAAHAVGVIHRDFKPDNVLIDEHGEPRVADFGLARTDETVDFDERERDEVSISEGLTATGQELGTPAYMAPEQYGGEIDRRVDVFAFCVVLHEALFGVRPFVESTIEARLGAIARGERVAVPRGERRLQRVLDRGLAAEPGRRFATMEELIAELERSGGQRGRWALAAGLVGALALGGTAVWSTRDEPCAAPDDRLRAAWSSAAIPRIEQAHFDALEHLEAQMTWSRLRPTIDGVVAALDQEELALCEAKRKGEIDDELAWRRGACLRLERGAIAYRLELAAEGDVAAPRGLDLGEPATWCRALAHELRDRAPDEANAAAHAEVERGLAEVAALNRMGRDDALIARVPAVIAAAEQIGEPLLAARARFELGRQIPDDDQASATLEQAAHAAAAEGEHVTAAKAWIYSGYYAADDRRRCLDAAHAELAQVVDPQVRDRVLVQAELLEAEILDDEGDREAARACLERAVVLARAEAPAAVPDILFMSTWLAWSDGDLELAVATQRELVRWHDDAFTPNRQAHSRALWDLADLELAAADFDAALATITHAREVGDEHDARAETARWLMSEAEIRLHRGELARVDQLFAELDQLRTSDDVQLHEKVRALKGVAALAHGDPRRAAEQIAIAIANGDGRPDFAIDAADALAARAEALRRDGHAETALDEVEPVLAEFREQHPRLPEHGRLALACAWLLHELARDREAIAHFDEALATLIDPSERAWAELGRAVAAGGPIAPELRDRVAAALQRWPGSHRYELDTLAHLR